MSPEREQSAPPVIPASLASGHDLTPRGLTRGAPVATIVTTIALVLATLAGLYLLGKATRIITWILVAGFFAVVLTPPVNWFVRRLHVPRSLAVGLVFVSGVAAIAGLGYTFVTPLARQATSFANDFPTYVKDAEEGRGTIGHYVKKYKLDDWLEKNQDELRKRAQDIFEPKAVFGTALGALGSVLTMVFAILTIAVLTILMLLEGHDLLMTASKGLRPHQRDRMIQVATDCARAINSYVNGNLLISVIAGLATFVFLLIAGVPFAGVLALWVAFADLIPLVGATMGAIPPVIVAFLNSTTTGVITVIFYVIYQQFENQVLQVAIMSKAVALKPLIVLASVLLGVELFGLLGALLAIPAAGIIRVVAFDLVAHRRPDLITVEHVHPGKRRGLSLRRTPGAR
jgi:predicted PurR-regulated permease PerM